MGPMPWGEVMNGLHSGRISNAAHIKNVHHRDWAPLMQLLHPPQAPSELDGLLPSRYDALFYLGVGIFMIGIALIFDHPLIGLSLLTVSPGIEVLALILEARDKRTTIAGAIGNVMAILWIIVQVIVTYFMAETWVFN